ncbi:MAG: methylmalonyl Co-A mutase-associated GTPase MeaB [Polyangiaceae bacterium]|nr:methylmalonyl Co-A mutase-associated GTPase MeaB [Polyangiaceae bacterium]
MTADEIERLARGVLASDRRALGKAITLVESSRADHQAAAQRLLESVLPSTGGAARLGVSGVPGAGKSTFIEALGLYLIGAGRRVAVLAVDPSSAVTGGSILGDKTRMPRLAAADAAFIRPSPAGGALGGVARHTREALLLCEAAGFDVVLVETVGVGQSEHIVSSMVDTFLLLALAGAGDELQGIKRGILELVDVIAINKADGAERERAERTAVEYKSALRLLRGDDAPWVPRVTTVSALEARGIDRVWALVEEHRSFLAASGQLTERRSAQRKRWLSSLVREALEAELWSTPGVQREAPGIEALVQSGAITPTEGARRLLATFRQR